MSGKTFYNNKQITKIFYGTKQIKKVFYGTQLVYSAGHIVTYHIDTNNVVSQEVDDGADCIANAPSATKSGFTLHGWRENSTASSSVLPSKTCDQDGIHLYAVFKKTLHLNTVTKGVTAVHNGTQYYNNNNYANPRISVADPTYTGTTFQGWSASSGSISVVNPSLAGGLVISADTNRYAVWKYGNSTIAISGASCSGSPDSDVYADVLTGIDGRKYSQIIIYNVGATSSPGNATTGQVVGYTDLKTGAETFFLVSHLNNAQYPYQDEDNGGPCKDGAKTTVYLNFNNDTNQYLQLWASGGTWCSGSFSCDSPATLVGKTIQY